MPTGASLERCFSYIGCQLNPSSHGFHPPAILRPTVTLSRQTGSGAMEIAHTLADYLEERRPAPRRWTVFDRNLVERVLEEHNLPKELARFMPEDRVSAIQDMVEELLGLHPPSWTLLRQTTETILHLAELGNVILVGRAANIITRRLNNVFHVRLVAPLDQRVERVMAHAQLSHAAALDFIKKEDLGRKRYLKDYFKADIEDYELYDLVVNTARLSHPEAVRLIGDAVLHWAETLSTPEAAPVVETAFTVSSSGQQAQPFHRFAEEMK
ncbi:MAG: cytidylate kinase-like family protein [Verrucomicrobia bacterium]|nr:cytidylate kinase-like family protein [Verrucomicrobiota bacterium]